MPILDDFPRDELEFKRRFATEEACRDYWISLRWPDGFVCPRCGHKGGYRLKDREEIQCADPKCGRQTSPRAGTVLHNSPKPIEAWLTAIFHMAMNKQGISAVRLQNLLGFGSYRTALRWLRELRRVLAPDEPFTGEVEFDETALGGVEEGGKGPYAGKTWIMGVAERRGRGCSRARLRVVGGASNASIVEAFVTQAVAPQSIILSDGAKAYYPALKRLPYVHDARATSKKQKRLRSKDGVDMAIAHLPQIHKVFSLVKRVVLGAYQGSISERHLQTYLDEYCFRLNRRDLKWVKRKDRVPLRIFQEIAALAASRQCVPYWRSSGRTAPEVPTRRRNGVWADLAATRRRRKDGEAAGG